MSAMKDYSKIALLVGLILLVVVLSRFDMHLGFNIPVWIAIAVVLWIILKRGGCCCHKTHDSEGDVAPEEASESEEKE